VAAHARIQSSAFARVMLRALGGSFVVFSTLRSVHLAVRLVAVVARRFVRVETGLFAGAILPKDRFAFEGVGLAVVVVEEFSLAHVRFRYPIAVDQLEAELVVGFAWLGYFGPDRPQVFEPPRVLVWDVVSGRP
jgi:hypothetical protein